MATDDQAALNRSYPVPDRIWQVNAAGERIAGPWPFSDPPAPELEGTVKPAPWRAPRSGTKERLG